MAEWKELRVLGKGSYAIVYLAVLVAPQVVKGGLIAVKSSGPQTLVALQKEENILRSFLGCQEIVQCLCSRFTIKNGCLNYNLLMEFAPHGSLRDLINKRPLLENEVRVYTGMLLKGLSSIGQTGVVHCDLKPDNILLFPSSEDGVEYQLKIADFGLSKTRYEKIDAKSWKMKFRGSPLYMSPESVMGQIDAPLDIWSLGYIVIEMLTRLPAWSNHLTSKNHITSKDIMFKLAVLKEAPEIPKGINQECKDFLSKCFVKDPSKRWTATMLLSHPFLTIPYDIFTGFKKQYPMLDSSFYSYDCHYVARV